LAQHMWWSPADGWPGRGSLRAMSRSKEDTSFEALAAFSTTLFNRSA
jgi:hypothetical protein